MANSIACIYACLLGREQWIYAARIIRTGHIKIGHTVNISRRMALLRGQFKSDIELIAVTEGTTDIERCIHKQSAVDNIPYKECLKEVYKPSPELMAFISREMRSPADAFGSSFKTRSVYVGEKPLTAKAVELACCRATSSGIDYRRRTRLACRIRREMKAGRDIQPFFATLKAYFGKDSLIVLNLEEEFRIFKSGEEPPKFKPMSLGEVIGLHLGVEVSA